MTDPQDPNQQDRANNITPLFGRKKDFKERLRSKKNHPANPSAQPTQPTPLPDRDPSAPPAPGLLRHVCCELCWIYKTGTWDVSPDARNTVGKLKSIPRPTLDPAPPSKVYACCFCEHPTFSGISLDAEPSLAKLPCGNSHTHVSELIVGDIEE